MSVLGSTSSRRSVLGGAVVAGATGAVATVGLAGPGQAAYLPATHRAARLLSPAGRHLVGRFSYGITPKLAAQVRRAGGPDAWFDKQLRPDSIRDRKADSFSGWWPSLARDAQDLWHRQAEDIEGGWEVMADYARWNLMRRVYSNRQVHELMAEFWGHHLNVPVNGDGSFTWRVKYGEVLRRHALGRFEDLLNDAITHPAMLIYLDAARSTAQHPNENLGRELLELHTVGRGNYDEDDVKSSARILTGWTVDLWSTWRPSYEPTDHWRGPVRVMGFSDPNAAADGRDLTRRYLRYLAHHPATARRIARKLAVKFVRDDPPESLVNHLADVYLANDTAIAPVLRALVGSAGFADSRRAKVRDPGEDLVATYRALRVRVGPPAGESHAVNAMLWQCSSMGITPFAWPRPDGQPIDNDSWSNPARLMASMRLHYVMCGTWWPKEGIKYRPLKTWIPDFPIRFNKLVDHLSREFLHRPSTPALLEAACQAAGVGPRERITRAHPVVKWQMPRLLTVFLDSPDFYTR